MKATDDYRILFTGSRRMTDWTPIYEAYRRLLLAEQEEIDKRPGCIVIVHGAGPGDTETGALGCDALVQRYFENGDFGMGVTIEPHPPLEGRFGRWPAAGPRRNSYMVGLGADACLAFPCRRSKGTTDCATKAWKAGIPTWIQLQRIP